MSDFVGLVLATDFPDRRTVAESAMSFEARIAPDWASLCDNAEAGVDMPFQHRIWIESWYDTIGRSGGHRPLHVEVRERSGRLAALLPLVRLEARGRTIITFPDDELTDYNAPLIGPAAPRDAVNARRFWRSVRRVLPPADVFVLRKSPYRLGGRVNPFSLLPGAGLCAANGNLIATDESLADYHQRLGKHVRGELERSWRVFSRAPGARFRPIDNIADAERALAACDAHQRARFEVSATPFRLDAPAPSAFYRRLAAHGVPQGYTYIAVLESDAEIVATLVAFVTGKRMVVTRISNAGRAWAACSPGRLIMHRAMMDLHAKGVREFDFSIGNYEYKRRFKAEPVPLFDLVVPLTWKGVGPAARARVASYLRRYPALDARVRGLIRV